MNTRKIKQIITHPALISLIILTAIALTLPLHFSKFRIKHVRDIYTSKESWIIYNDLDSDGNSEEISIDLADKKQTKIIVSSNGKVLDQYNLRFQPNFHQPSLIEDYNLDGFKEIYVFTLSEDSIFLNIIDPLKSRDILVSGRFVDLYRKSPNSNDLPNIIPIRPAGSKDRRSKDLFFYINSGYNLQPRNIYKYIISEDSLVKSPESGAVIIGCTLTDLDGDSSEELLLSTLATGNTENDFPYSDNYSWLMVLDENLSFTFPPKKLGSLTSFTVTLPVVNDDKKNILAFFSNFGSDTIGSALYLFDMEGHEIARMPVLDNDPQNSTIFPCNDDQNTSFFYLKDRHIVVKLDNSFKELDVLQIPGVINGEMIGKFDADLDGTNEYFFVGENRSSILIVKDNFENPVLWQHPLYHQWPIFSQYLKRGEKPLLFAQFSETGMFIRYEKNPYNFLKYPFYLGLYGLLYLFILLIAHSQRFRLNVRKEQERKLLELQLKVIKNQIDPHFTLNVINAIGSLYSDEMNRDKADYIFAKYAKLIRQTVLSSDKVVSNIEEELDFVRNYLDIERFRRDNAFRYSVTIEEGSDVKTRIPRMLIHTFVENAIKHGIRNKAGDGLLNIHIHQNDGHQSIVIENNGPFQDSNHTLLNGTGKGLIILNELINLFFKLENVKITYDIQTILDEDTANPVTRVTVTIPSVTYKVIK